MDLTVANDSAGWCDAFLEIYPAPAAGKSHKDLDWAGIMGRASIDVDLPREYPDRVTIASPEEYERPVQEYERPVVRAGHVKSAPVTPRLFPLATTIHPEFPSRVAARDTESARLYQIRII